MATGRRKRQRTRRESWRATQRARRPHVGAQTTAAAGALPTPSVERVPGARAERSASVVVPVRDGADDVGVLLAALAAQTVPPERFEVLVADDGSAVELAPLTESYANVRLLRGPRRNAYAARNRAAAVARGRVLAFCDADCRPEPRWLESGLAALQHPELAAGPIPFARPHRRTIGA